MKTLFTLLVSAVLLSPAMATVSIEFQFGAINVPAGSLGVLVADVNNDGFHSPAESAGTALAAGQKIGADDVIVTVFSNATLSDWGGRQGFADQFAVIDYDALEVTEGQSLILYVFPERVANDTLRTGQPHLDYRSEDLGDLTANSNMEFALPADGGAYLLAVLGTDVGGDADLAAMDISKFPLTGSAGTIARSLGATASHTYYFDFSGPGAFSLLGRSASGVVATLYDAAGDPVTETDGTGNFLINETIAEGLYTLVLSNSPGTGALIYDLDFSSNSLRSVRPDVAVGSSMAARRGVGIYSTRSGQTLNLTSTKTRTVVAIASVANRGGLPDTMKLRSTRGSTLFAVAYTGPAGNMTSSLVAGRASTYAMDQFDSPIPIRATIKPNKKKLTKKRGKRLVYLKKSFNASVQATSTFNPALSDAAYFGVKTR